jgi:hypothetical protein
MKDISSEYPFDISLKNVDITAGDFIQKNKKLPIFVSLSNEEFDVLLLERKYSIFEMQDSLES